MQAISLTDLFGEERSKADAAGCVEAAVTDWLRGFRVSP